MTNKKTVNRTIKSMTENHRQDALELVERVFTEFEDETEGKAVRSLVEEIRSKKYYLPKLELIAVDDSDRVIGYVMFSGFHLEGKYEDKLLILAPAAVETTLQRQHISKELIEYGFQKAVEMGFEAVLVEGNPKNYHARGFRTAADYGILPGKTVHLPHIDCLMVKELKQGALKQIKGILEYDFYRALT